ncbi:uncharacterized protein LOC143295285 isoform X1 [Babylonia areolata]|uniref:uncharacterized protein LOC143295285 isoform X1 n=1 Tax=Babylonia areolata TaxID=304850 RepID=UPI003FD413A5
MAIVEVRNKEEFKKILDEAGSKLVVVDFHALWCGPCKVIAPKLKKWSEKDFSDVIFIKVDVDEAEELAEEQGVTAMPTFRLFKNGEKVDELIGANADNLEAKINANK